LIDCHYFLLVIDAGRRPARSTQLDDPWAVAQVFRI
jgi:hypothetical protein